MNKWFVILNPVSGNNFVKKRKEKVLDSLQKLESPFEVAFTKYSKHEEELVERAVKKGFKNFISVGGDGTLHHVLNGVMLQKEIPVSEIKIGVIPVGTGNDWVKNNFVPKNIEKAIEVLNRNNITKLDIGKLTHESQITYFNTLTGMGFDGYVVHKSNKLKKLGKIAYPVASIFGFLTYKKCELSFAFNDKEISSKSLMAIIGLGKYCGGGMQLTTKVDSKDGLFDITLVKNISKISLFLNVKKMYNGKLANLKKVEVYKTDKIKVKVLGEKVPFIQADGEIIGKGDFEVEILPLKVSFVVGSN